MVISISPLLVDKDNSWLSVLWRSRLLRVGSGCMSLVPGIPGVDPELGILEGKILPLQTEVDEQILDFWCYIDYFDAIIDSYCYWAVRGVICWSM